MASATMPARKPYISQVSLLTYTHTHTHLCGLYGGIQEAFPADRHKKGAGLRVEKPAQEEKKKKSPPPPPPLLILHSPSLSLSPPPSPTNLSPWPLQCCAVPAGFQGAANGLRLIYMQPGWDTCRPSSPSNGSAQESTLNTTGEGGGASTTMASLHFCILQQHTYDHNQQRVVLWRCNFTDVL